MYFFNSGAMNKCDYQFLKLECFSQKLLDRLSTSKAWLFLQVAPHHCLVSFYLICFLFLSLSLASQLVFLFLLLLTSHFNCFYFTVLLPKHYPLRTLCLYTFVLGLVMLENIAWYLFWPFDELVVYCWDASWVWRTTLFRKNCMGYCGSNKCPCF